MQQVQKERVSKSCFYWEDLGVYAELVFVLVVAEVSLVSQSVQMAESEKPVDGQAEAAAAVLEHRTASEAENWGRRVLVGAEILGRLEGPNQVAALRKVLLHIVGGSLVRLVHPEAARGKQVVGHEDLQNAVHSGIGRIVDSRRVLVAESEVGHWVAVLAEAAEELDFEVLGASHSVGGTHHVS